MTAIQRLAAVPKVARGYVCPPRIRLYRWLAGTTFGVVYASALSRDALVRRLARLTGEVPSPIQGGDFALSEVARGDVREGWERAARADGAVLATGLAAR